MPNEEKDLLIAYLVDAGELDPGSDVEEQFLDWYQVRQDRVSGEVHYKAVLDAARIRKQSFKRGFRLGATLRWNSDREPVGHPSKELTIRQRSCDHGNPCFCFVEGYAANLGQGHAEGHEGGLELASRIRQTLDDFELAGGRTSKSGQVSPAEERKGEGMIFAVHVVPHQGPAFQATVDADNNWSVPDDPSKERANLLASFAEIELVRSGVPHHLDSRGAYANALVAALPGSRVLYSVPPQEYDPDVVY